MSIASRFLTRPEGGAMIALTLDGAKLMAQPGDSVAAAILAQSGDGSRRTVKGVERAPYCMMGVCFDCLVEIDGQPNVQACMTTVREGMVVRRQDGLRGLGGDNNAKA